jgi:hypothetical protein
MPSYRVSAVPLCATALIAAAALTACATSRLSAELPPGVHLAGDWKLDTPRSDDLGRAVDELRAQAQKVRRAMESRQTQGASLGTGAGPPRGSTVDELMSSVPRGDYLRISVSANSFTVASGDSSDQYTPGLQSEISAEQGDAQQISGWKGEDYVIDTKPQWGAEIIQRYGLTKEGKLEMTVRLTGRGTKLTFTRVYDRTAGVAPLAPPTIN